MKQYLDLCKKILEDGHWKDDRTGTGTYSIFGYQARYNLEEGFPLLTTKKVFLRGIIHELLWFISGSTNIKYLVDNNVHIWDDWAYKAYSLSDEFKGETMEEFAEEIKNADENSEFVKKWGELGPVYGRQWRNFNEEGVDQLENLINQIKTNPNSRRLIISAWNPCEVDKMALPPCHSFMQFYVINGKLSCQLYQRSADIFLGVPFNIASYSLFTMMIAQVCGLKVGEFIHTMGDAHIYTNHVDQIKTNPNSRRLIISAWNPCEVDQMALPPCHSFMQFYVIDNKLSCQLYQRSADVFLGVPFNIASYSLFTMMIAQVCGLGVGEFIHTMGDAHIYSNHVDQIKLQLSRDVRPLPKMKINPNVKSIYDFKIDDFTLEGYEPWPRIKGEVAV